MSERLDAAELVALVERVFCPGSERGLAILADLPDPGRPCDAAWRARIETAAAWARTLSERRGGLGFDTCLVLYPNVGTNNGDLPERAWIHAGGALPVSTDDLDPAGATTFPEIFASNSMLMALTEFSATAPLKLAARGRDLRAATMGGFCAAMIPALRLDYGEINRRVVILKDFLDRATGAELRFRDPEGECLLHLDLRHRTAHASGGLLAEAGVAGNLPSGEAYIVPYEGEVPGEPSRSEGILPVQFGTEVVRYRIRRNQAQGVFPGGPEALREAGLLVAEPAYGNLAELGLGVLGAFGIRPIGEVLLDEKLGPHLAFGRSDHFGGQVGPGAFSRPEAVVHIDRVYVPEVQPLVRLLRLDLRLADGHDVAVIRDGAYVLDFTPRTN